MKLSISFEKYARYFPDQQPSMCIYLKFSDWQFDDFCKWIDDNKDRLNNICLIHHYEYDIGYGDQGIKISQT